MPMFELTSKVDQMRNLVKNHHGVFTYRKYINGQSIRVSLHTRDKLEAIRIADKLSSILDTIPISNANHVRAVIYSVLSELQPEFQKERLNRLQNMLGISLDIDEGEPLSDIIAYYIKEKNRSNSWSEKTHDLYSTILNHLVQIIGNKNVNFISIKDAQRVKEVLQKLPSNQNKRAIYRGKSVNQVLKMSIPESHLLSITTINIRLSCYTDLFRWSVKNGYAKTNVFEGLTLKDNRNSRELREPFTPTDLQQLFTSPEILNSRKPWQYWLPVLGLYTGARLNELCQIQLKDIQQVGGIWVLSINDDGQDQTLKTQASRRIIPLHNELIRLGFLDFVSNLSSEKSARIFPEFTLQYNRFSHTPSKWFSRVKSQVLANSNKKSFHSFRHTFVDYLFNNLKLQGNPIVKVLIGHTDKEITSGIYGSTFEIEDLNDIVQQIDFREHGVEIKSYLSQVQYEGLLD